jgi:hypothetical protein
VCGARAYAGEAGDLTDPEPTLAMGERVHHHDGSIYRRNPALRCEPAFCFTLVI